MRYLLAVLCVMYLASLSLGNDTKEPDFSQYKWKNRVLILFSPSEKYKAYLDLNKEIESSQAGIKDRDMVIITAIKNKSVWIDKKKASYTYLDLLNKFELPNSDYTVILIGKDGGIKLKTYQPVTLKTVFKIIDAMPMRQREMNR